MFAPSFTLLVSLICATASLAAPVLPTPALPGGDIVSLVPVSAVTPVVGTVVGTAGTLVPVNDIVPRAASVSTLPQIIGDLATKITPILNHIKAAVEDEADLSVELVKSDLQQVIVILTTTRDDVKAIVEDPLALVGATLDTVIADVLAALGPVLQLVFAILSLIMAFVANSSLGPILTPLVAEVGALVGAILALVLQLLPGLLGPIIPILSALPVVSGVVNILGL